MFQAGDIRRPYRRLGVDYTLNDVIVPIPACLKAVPNEFRTGGNEYAVFRDAEFWNVAAR
jgi:hypothetical protein